ncbi:amino acid ABC transporter substrate-binding protein, PAAT family [Streptomyces sp. DvalAA-14]|uniref:ABC transporter substrate-binding protein n=1 Tax=unclassified Streptomyces TaxID=2593676 RepID=UPI00081B405F|nr:MULTISPECIES: ABC transporter substrate-binding protein [unclassified Streptomyces]MYS19024.1 transporter substrate-binding domain-containing protein [Streptomyces sp. SID4948]SCD34391.1 amino acid ABC transporter substrate-binding protein, PAAT family [Streptomyces sp. DvalAA-14]
MPTRTPLPTQRRRGRLVRGLTAATAVATLAAGLAACGSDSSAASSAGSTPSGVVTIGAQSNGAAVQTDLHVPEVPALHAELPASVARSGKLVIGIGALPAGSAPLNYIGGDQKTLTGVEPDFGRLVAAVLGLRPELRNATWDNLFVGIDSGRTDVGFSNITDTEERKKKYDFASYREDNLAFEVLRTDTWNFGGNYESLAGKTVAVGAGTNQEKILLEWKAKLQREGKDLTVKYFPDNNSTYLALDGKKIDAFFGPNPSIAYHVIQDAKTPGATRNAGKFSGAGQSLQGLIAATTKKGNGLVKPVADAINHLIATGQYARWLKAWNLSNEAVATSLVNPPGLPVTNS